MTKLTKLERIVAAAAFARSNIIGAPTRENVQWCIKHNTDLGSAVCTMCGDLIESDEMEKMFQEEAESWHTNLKNETREDLTRVHPHIAQLIW